MMTTAIDSWSYQGKPFNEELTKNRFGFVYQITNLNTGRKYIGKKRFNFISHKRLKSKKRRIKVIKKSDWLDYYGSSDELVQEVESGKYFYTREILKLCNSSGDCSYWELYYQMMNHVLLRPDDYYNSYVGARIHRKHILGKTDNEHS